MRMLRIGRLLGLDTGTESKGRAEGLNIDVTKVDDGCDKKSLTPGREPHSAGLFLWDNKPEATLIFSLYRSMSLFYIT